MTTQPTPFLKTAIEPTIVTNSDFQNLLTQYIKINYPSYRLRKELVKPEDAIDLIESDIQLYCDVIYMTHNYTYTKLYNTTQLEYNPIENYNMKEHENVQNSGIDKTSFHHDAYSDTENLGDFTITDNYGNTVRHSETDGNTAPFDTQTYKKVNQSIVDETQQARTDSRNQTAVDNTRDYGEKNSTESLEHGHDVERDLTRSGNIGVTTSQQMLQSERDVSRFNFVRIVANDIIKTICVNSSYPEGRFCPW